MDRMINNYEEWLSDFRNQKIDINSSRIDLNNMVNRDPAQYVQNLLDQGVNLNRSETIAIKNLVGKQNKQAAKAIKSFDKSAGFGGQGVLKSLEHDNLYFSSNIGDVATAMKNLPSGISHEQASSVIQNAANMVYKDLGLQDVPLRVNMQYGHGLNTSDTVRTGTFRGDGVININMDDIISKTNFYNMSPQDTVNEIANNVAHEMRHAWQQHFDNINYRSDADNYIDIANNVNSYLDQAIEVDARRYGSYFQAQQGQNLYNDVIGTKSVMSQPIPSTPQDLPTISLDFGGGPTLENSAQIGKQLKLEDLQDFSGKLGGMYSNDEITIHQLTYGRQQVNNAIQSGRSSNYESFNISDPSFFDDPNNVKNFTGTVKEIDSVPNLVRSDMTQLSSTDYKTYNTAMLYDERLRNNIAYAEPIRSSNRAQRAIANDSEGLFTLRNYLSHEIATESDYALFGLSDAIGEGVLNGKSMHDITYNFLRNGPNAVKVNGQSIDAQPFFYFDKNKNLKVVAEPLNPSDSFEKFRTQPEIAKGRQEFMEEMVVNKTYFNDPKNIEAAVNALEQQGFHISTSVDTMAHRYRLEEKINDMKKDYAKHPERYKTKSHPQTQSSGGGGGRKGPPKNTTTATPEPPKKPKRQQRDTTYDNIEKIYDNAKDLSSTQSRRTAEKEKNRRATIEANNQAGVSNVDDKPKQTQKKQTTQKSGPGENKTSNSTRSDTKKTTNVFEQHRQQQAKDTGGTKIDTSRINKNKNQAQKQQKKQTQNKVKKEQAQHVADNIPQKEIPKQRIAKAQKGTGKYRVKEGQAVKDVSQMQVTSTGGGKIPYRIKGSSNNGALNISGGLDANGKPVFMTATVKAGDKATKYNLLGGGKKGQYKSLASFQEQVAYAMDSGVNVPQWARAAINRKSGKPRTSTYNVEEIPKSDWTETVAEEVINRVNDNFNHRADPRSSNMGGGKEYDPTKPIMGPGAEQKAKEIEKNVQTQSQLGPTRASADEQKYEEVQSKIDDLTKKFVDNEIDTDEYLQQTNNVHKQYNDYLENHWDREEARVQKEAEVKQKQVDYENATNQVEKDYADGNLTDDEYVDELNKLHEEYESFMNEKYPLDDSNVLNKSEQQRSIDQMNDIVDNLTTDSSDPYNRMIDPLNKNKPQTKPTPSPDDGFELSMNQNKFNPQTPPDQRRIFTQEELDTEFDKLQDLFDDGKITNEQYTQMADKLKKRFKPLTDDELRQAKKEEIMGDPDYYLDRSGETSTIKKHFDRDDYSIDMSNTYVDKMSFDGEVYDIKYKNHPESGEYGFDAYDSQGNLVLDEKVLDKIQSQGSAELNQYFHSLTDDEWMEMRKNPTQHRFNAHDAASSGGQKYADILNEQAVLEKQKAVLNEQISDLQNQLGNTKGKKAKKSILAAQNKKRIKNVEANRDYTILKHKAEAMKNKDAALDVFHKELGLDQFEHKSAEYFDALKKLKGTDKYKAATETLRQSTQTANQTMAKQIANTNKYANSQIKGLQGKGLTPGNVISVGMSAIAAVNTYKEKRSEGKSVASSAIRAAGSAVAAEMLGMPGQLALAAAKTIPAAIMGAGEHLYQENRRMNSAANYAPLGGATFEDSQQLATMRQSGMELAKMAQYNLEQTLMGAEAKHLHR